MSNAIGIDFGTTKTMVSYLNPATGRPELVRLGRDRDSVPTTIHVDESGEFLFGEDADDLIATDPEGYCRAFKLQLGEMDPVLPRAGQTAEALAARFLHYIKKECEQSVFHGESVDTATLTIPVVFSPARKASLERAANAAGFSSVSFLPEPEAAGTAFLRDNPADKFSRAVVLDWGGGTLDIAMISRDREGNIHADRQCADGRDDIGGEEMDRVLLYKIDELWSEKYGVNLLGSGENESQLLREAEKAKIFLSRKESTVFRKGPRTIDISRALFNELVDPFVRDAVALIRNALSKNGAKGEAVPDAILLIGGTSLLSIVRETMEKEFPEIRVLSWHHSHEAVALGASRAEMASQAPSPPPPILEETPPLRPVSPPPMRPPPPPPPVAEKPPQPSVDPASHLQNASNMGSARKKFIIRRIRHTQTADAAKPIRIAGPGKGNEAAPPSSPPIAASVGFGKAWLRRWTCWNRSGRATRSEYWWGVLSYVTECLVAMIVSIMATDEPNGPVFWIWFLISLYPTICQQVRRLHDADHSGVWVILEAMLYIVSPFVPETWPLSLIVGLVVFVFLLRPGDEGANRYGVRS